MLDEFGLDRQAVLELKIEGGVASEDSATGEAEGRIKVKGVGQECPTHTS